MRQRYIRSGLAPKESTNETTQLVCSFACQLVTGEPRRRLFACQFGLERAVSRKEIARSTRGTRLALREGMQQSMARALRPRRARGVTLFEVLVVVAILALVSSGVALAALTILERVKIREAEKGARVVRASVKAWWTLQNDPGCPTVDDLIREGVLDRDSTRTDPWGQTWRLECGERDVTVVSLGPDRTAQTDDDIRIPPA